MWKMTTAAGAINFKHVRRLRIQKANWVFQNKMFNCAIVAEGEDFNYDFEYFDDEQAAQDYLKSLISELNFNDET